jgi:ketosteroid isomerase-like protein
MDDQTDHLLRQLTDKQEILEQIYRYCRGLDRLDEPTLRAVYHPDAVEDRGEGVFVGSAHEMASRAIEQLRTAYAASQHFIGNVLIDLEGDVAFAESYFQAYHRYADRTGKPPTELIMAGRYLDRFERRQGVWKIAHRKMVNDWSRTQPVSDPWLERHGGAHRSRRSIDDSQLQTGA